MCAYSLQKNGLPNSACQGWASTARPSRSVNPLGWFIQALTEITNIEPVTPAIAIGIPASRCSLGLIRSQPYT